jgi:hypothetical protein
LIQELSVFTAALGSLSSDVGRQGIAEQVKNFLKRVLDKILSPPNRARWAMSDLTEPFPYCSHASLDEENTAKENGSSTNTSLVPPLDGQIWSLSGVGSLADADFVRWLDTMESDTFQSLPF